MKKVYIISERSKTDKHLSTFHGVFSSLKTAKTALLEYLNDENLMDKASVKEYERGYTITTKDGTNIDIYEAEIDKVQ